MITKVMQQIPEQIKLPVDLAAGTTSVLAWLEVATGALGLVGVTLSIGWGILRLLNEFEDYKKKRK